MSDVPVLWSRDKLAKAKRRLWREEIIPLMKRIADPADPFFCPAALGFKKPTKAEKKFIKRRKVKL